MTGLRKPLGDHADDLSNDLREIWLARRLLGQEGIGLVWRGFTSEDIRRDRMRELITPMRKYEIAGRDRQGRERTFAELFEIVYGEPL